MSINQVVFMQTAMIIFTCLNFYKQIDLRLNFHIFYINLTFINRSFIIRCMQQFKQ
jgi:hypothetical protein